MNGRYSEHSFYRWNFVKRTIIPVFVTPLLVTFLELAALHSFQINPRWFLAVLLYPLTAIIHNVLRIQLDDWLQRREAHRLGARLVPRVQGKWIGNLDLLMKKSTKIPYIGQRLEEIAEEIGSRTFNLRILWVDNVRRFPTAVSSHLRVFRLMWMIQIISLDEKVAKFVLATRFDNFGKGFKAHEMTCVHLRPVAFHLICLRRQ